MNSHRMSGRRFDGFLFDMDGVLYRGSRRLPGASEMLRALDRAGIRYALVTNNSTRTPGQYVRLLRGMGMPVPAARIVTTAVATSGYLRTVLQPRARVLVIGEDALRRTVLRAGFVLAWERVAAVVVGLDRRLTYRKLTLATQALLAGARFIATNPDPLLPTAEGFVAGAGTGVAALRYATGRVPLVIGKPRPLLLREAMARIGASPAHTAMVGDQVSTDIVAGRAAGMYTILVKSGVSEVRPGSRRGPRPDLVVHDLVELRRWLAGQPAHP
jgi:4-nitrophenyl phosphatase